jgi:hypothetical protein
MIVWPQHIPPDQSQALSGWASRAHAAAATTLADPQARLGHRAIEPWLAAWLGERPSPNQPASRQPDVRLWRSLVLRKPIAAQDLGLEDRAGPASLLPPAGDDTPIEVWTEAELCTMHGLWHAARLGPRPAWRRRCLDAAVWHAENLQPDNATNIPWALHVFAIAGALARAEDERLAAALDLHAQTLLHNALVTHGRPDPLSARVLLDAARAIRAELGEV